MKNLRDLDLNLLLVFEAIYTNGNITQAAQAMGLSQPTISNSLSRLRETLDDQLFVRSGRGVIPTARAQALIGPIQRALKEISTATQPEEVFDPTTSKREFNIHMFDSMDPVIMPHLVSTVLSAGKVSFRMLLAPAIAVDDVIESKKADIGIGLEPGNRTNLRWEALCPLDLVVIAREGHPVVNGSITDEQFESLGHVSLDFTPGANANANRIRLQKRMERHDVVKVSRPSAIPALVAVTDLIGLFNRSGAEALAKTHKLQILETPYQLGSQSIHIIWHQSNSNDPSIIWLREQIKQAVADHQTAHSM